MKNFTVKTWLLVAAALLPISASAATVVASVPQPMYQAGDLIPVSLSINSVTDLYAFQVDLTFDPLQLSAQSVTEGGYFAANGVGFGPATIDNTAGTISYIADSLSGTGPGFTGATTLATIDFMAKGAGHGMVSPVNITLLDSSLNTIAETSTAATVNVAALAPEPGQLGMWMLGAMVLWGAVQRRGRAAGPGR